MHSLTQKLQVYVEIERPLMIKQIYSFYEVLKHTESAINTSQGLSIYIYTRCLLACITLFSSLDVTLRKQQITNLYNQHKEEHEKYKSYAKQMPRDLYHVQIKINEFIEGILYQLLNGILDIERRDLQDKQINQAFEVHFRSCIDRINVALQGAGDRRQQITEELEKQQSELQKKDVEIARLKDEVAQQLARKGEGDCLAQKVSEQSAIIKEQLCRVTAERDEKDALVSKLEEQLQIIKNELSKYEDCSALRNKNNFFKEAEQSTKQLAMKNKEIGSLTEQLGNLFEVTKSSQAVMEDKIKELEKKLHDLAVMNDELRSKLMEADEIISGKDELIYGKDETIINMKNIVDRSKNILSHKSIEYQNTMDEKHREIAKLKEENEQLNEKVKDMNRTIVSLTEHRDKIDMIYTLLDDFSKLEKNERKLKAELNNLKAQLANDQNNNKKLDNNLDVFLRENEHLKKSVEYWKNENSELSMKLSNQMVEEKLRSDLYTLSNTIYNRLLILKNQFESEKYISSDRSKEKFQDKNVICVDDKMTLTIDDINNEQTSEYDYQNRKVKENEIEEVGEQQLSNITTRKNETFKSNYVKFERLSPSESNNLQISYKTDRLVNESEENEAETRKLLEEIEIRDSEIRNLKEVIDHLAQENTHLRAVLKSQIEEYQDKITLMKKNYDSSLNALCGRHKESVETLQRRFEDIITGERSFDSENWLQSLNTKELTELYERIRAITGDPNLIHARDENQYFYKNSVRKEFYTEITEPEKMLHTSYKNICENEAMPNNIVSLTQQDNSDLQNQWRFTILRQTQEYPVSQMQDYKFNLKENFGCSNREMQPPELEHKYEKEKEIVKDNTVDQQRWNFIKQCSAYHKLSNSCEYL
ncbi:uncharacterized protein LOC143367512 isoform X2 [Andrena cerasifolii]|uniref:uncharacterized protein LOC143367512 isoform X2 n=1 Tax=Andrena cerasifolii TaxID=2819439 RepID=UPI00403843D8